MAVTSRAKQWQKGSVPTLDCETHFILYTLPKRLEAKVGIKRETKKTKIRPLSPGSQTFRALLHFRSFKVESDRSLTR